MKMLAQISTGVRHWSQYAACRAMVGSGTLITMILVSGAGGHWN